MGAIFGTIFGSLDVEDARQSFLKRALYEVIGNALYLLLLYI